MNGGREGCPGGPGDSYRGARGLAKFKGVFKIYARGTVGNKVG